MVCRWLRDQAQEPVFQEADHLETKGEPRQRVAWPGFALDDFLLCYFWPYQKASFGLFLCIWKFLDQDPDTIAPNQSKSFGTSLLDAKDHQEVEGPEEVMRVCWPKKQLPA